MASKNSHTEMEGSGGGGRQYMRQFPMTHTGVNQGNVSQQVVMYNQGGIQIHQQQQRSNVGMGMGSLGAYLHQQQQHSVVAAAYAPYQQQYASSASGGGGASSMSSGHPTISSGGSGTGLLGSGANGLLGSGSDSGANTIPTAAQMLQNGVQNVNVNNNFVEIGESSSTGIRDVWSFNLREEFRTIRSLARNGFNYIAIDTEFPGAPVRPVGTFKSTTDYQFQILRVNCDCLRIIQIGFTLLDGNGALPPGICTWQFNFKFSLTDDMYASDSIELLQGSGIQFHRMEADGIDPITFSEYLYSSGLVLNEDIRWISFHSGYDFGYMYRILMDRRIPSEENEFFTVLKMFFPFVYDIKYLMKSCKTLKGGLQELADELQVQRLGPSHQAGSDSLLTGLVFFKLREMYFEDIIDDDKYNGRLYGLAGTYYADDFEPMIPMIALQPPDSVVAPANDAPPVYPLPPIPSTSEPEPKTEAEKENLATANTTISTLAVLSSAMASTTTTATNGTEK